MPQSARSPVLAADRFAASRAIWSSGLAEGPCTPPPEEVQSAYFEGVTSSPRLPVQPNEEPLVVVVGVGYVGLHLVQAFGRVYDVIAYDISQKRIEEVKSDLEGFPRVTMMTDSQCFARATHFLVSVPTLVTPTHQLDTSHIRTALSTLAMLARPGSSIIVESSVSVGMTRSLLRDILVSCNLKGGMSPERVDPGRTEPAFEEIPKIVSGLDDIAPGSLESIESLYSRVFHNLVTVSSPEVAEMTKLYENCQRMMCIAFANEMADASVNLGIDPFEVAKAAASKPFGYLPMSPSPGVGGHCIPVNPHYLFATSPFPLLRHATETMASRPGKLVDEAMSSLQKYSKRRPRTNSNFLEPQRKRVLVVGMGFKRGQSVLSHSPGVAMVQHLQEKYNVDVSWSDVLVEDEAVPCATKLDPQDWHVLGLSRFNLIIVANRQVGHDYEVLDRLPRTLVVDWSA